MSLKAKQNTEATNASLDSALWERFLGPTLFKLGSLLPLNKFISSKTHILHSLTNCHTGSPTAD